MRKRSTHPVPKERAAHGLKGGSGEQMWKVAFELKI